MTSRKIDVLLSVASYARKNFKFAVSDAKAAVMKHRSTSFKYHSYYSAAGIKAVDAARSLDSVEYNAALDAREAKTVAYRVNLCASKEVNNACDAVRRARTASIIADAAVNAEYRIIYITEYVQTHVSIKELVDMIISYLNL
jgi:hypothetical protein